MSEPRIAIATPGGDAPGMNACIRAVVKGSSLESPIIGIRSGGLGLLRNSQEHRDYINLHKQDVSNILNRSGTILKSTRESRFLDYVTETLDKAPTSSTTDITFDRRVGMAAAKLGTEVLAQHGIKGLILVGGDTTCRAAQFLYEADNNLAIVVVPATIDNDIQGTSQTIGFDSAVSMAVNQVDAIRETAASMDRVFVVEVMGRQQGHLAAEVALATGAEVVLIPEETYSPKDLREIAKRIAWRIENQRESVIVVVAEGVHIPPLPGTLGGKRPSGTRGPLNSPARDFGGYISAASDAIEVRISILGHTLRGAPPTAYTRNLATRSGLRALGEIIHQLKQKGARLPPRLVGVHRDDSLSLVKITGDMIRKDSLDLRRMARDQNERLAY